jgi:hypothetical protein
MAGLDCPRQLWNLLWDRRNMAPHDAMTELIFMFGRRFGELAHSLYPDGVLIDVNIFKLDRAVEDTRKAIEDGANVVLEAAFRHEQCRVLSDVVERQADGTWHLVEVKSSTRVKDEHFPDLAYQKWVMEHAGYLVSRCSVIHADTSGTWPDVPSVFKKVDVTDEVNVAVQAVSDNVAAMVPLAQPGSEAPEARPLFSRICHDCNFKATVCWKGISEPTIYDVIDSRKIAGLEALGILYVKDIPDDYSLYAKDRDTVTRMNNRSIDIDKPAVRSMLEELEYPICFLDFETVSVAVPMFDGNHPWEQLPFQYSLHVLEESGEIRHLEYLHEEHSDPSRALAERLDADVGESGSVVVYFAQMESGVLRYLADRFPQYAAKFIGMNDRMWDLEVIFRKHYRHWLFGSKSSIKVVLPALVPDESYDDEEISDGGEASWSWVQMLESDDMLVRQQKADALRSYCKKDTIAMVKLLEHVQSVI